MCAQSPAGMFPPQLPGGHELGPNLHWAVAVDALGPYRQACDCSVARDHALGARGGLAQPDPEPVDAPPAPPLVPPAADLSEVAPAPGLGILSPQNGVRGSSKPTRLVPGNCVLAKGQKRACRIAYVNARLARTWCDEGAYLVDLTAKDAPRVVDETWLGCTGCKAAMQAERGEVA